MQAKTQDSTRAARPSRSTQPDDAPAPDRPLRSGRPSQSSQSGRGGAPRENAFSAHFLDRARRRDGEPALAETPLSRQAEGAGPWEVERVPAGSGQLFAVVRRGEPAREGGGARLAFLRRQDALLGAAALTPLATPSHLSVNTEKRSGRRCPLGHPIHDGDTHLGHASRRLLSGDDGTAAAFLASYHTLRCLAADPEALSLLIDALSTETLNLVGRAIMRRLT